MRRSQIDEVLRVLDDVFKQLGFEGGFIQAAEKAQRATTATHEVGTAQAAIARVAMAIGEYLFQQHGGKGLKRVLEGIDGFSTLDRIERALAREPDLTDEDLAGLEKLKRVPQTVRQALGEVARTIRPKGGHPVLVPRSDYPIIRDEVSRYIRSGMKVGAAKQRAAANHGCSVSTVNQIWGTRKDSD